MLNIKEAVEQLSAYGIIASEQDIEQWIENGHLNAEVNHQRRKPIYEITYKDLSHFAVQKKTDEFAAKLEQSKIENHKLAEQMDMINTRLHIEQSKVRTLKKLLNEQIETAGPHKVHFNELLGLKKETNSQSLKKEFKKLLKALHPDRGGDERLFKVFHRHYENLKS